MNWKDQYKDRMEGMKNGTDDFSHVVVEVDTDGRVTVTLTGLANNQALDSLAFALAMVVIETGILVHVNTSMHFASFRVAVTEYVLTMQKAIYKQQTLPFE